MDKSLTTRTIGYRDTPNGPQLWVQFDNGGPVYYRVPRADGVKWRTVRGGTLQPGYVPSECEAEQAIKRARMRS